MTAEPEDIPAFLRISQEERAAGWRDRPLTRQGSGGTEEEWEIKQRRYREALAAEQEAKEKAHNARGRERMQAKHPGQMYDRKLGEWVTATVTGANDADEPEEPVQQAADNDDQGL